MENALRQQILDLEQQRLAALMEGDIDALGALMADDLVHIHGNGQMDEKAAYLHGVAKKYRFHRVERGDLKIRKYGDVIVVCGPLEQTVSVNGIDKLNEIKAMVTQTWISAGESWKQSTCHMGFLSIT